MQEFFISVDLIELVKLLKLSGWAATGGHAKIMVDNGEVLLNGKREFRKKAKIRPGDIVEIPGGKMVLRKK